MKTFGASRLIGSIQQVQHASVQQQSRLISVKEDSRNKRSSAYPRSACPAAIAGSPAARGREERYGSKVISASRAPWKKITIISAAQAKARFGARSECSDGADQKRDSGQQQRRTQIGKRLQRDVFHVPQRQRVGRRIGAQRVEDVARSWHVTIDDQKEIATPLRPPRP